MSRIGADHGTYCVFCNEFFHDEIDDRMSGERFKGKNICTTCVEKQRIKHGLSIPKGADGRCEDPRHRCPGPCGRWYCKTHEADRTYIPPDEVQERGLREGRPPEYQNYCIPCYYSVRPQ